MPEEAIAIETKSEGAAEASAAASTEKQADPFASVKIEAAQSKEGEGAAAKGGEQKVEGAAKEKVIAKAKGGQPDLQTRVAQQNKAIADKDARIKALEGEVGTLKSKSGGDTTALTTQMETLRKENQRLQSELGARDYTKHPEYQAKFEAPFKDAADYAKTVVDSLTVTDADGNERPADWKKDFATLYTLPRSAARMRAKELFGEDATTVMNHYDELHKLDGARQKAMSEWQGSANEREQRDRAQQLEQSAKVSKGFEVVTQNLRESDPMFQESPDDSERSELWKKSEGIVDKCFDEGRRSKLTLPERVLIDAAVRLRAINEPILRHQLAKRDAEIAELKARIEGKASSKNGDVRRQGDKIEGKDETPWTDDLKKSLAEAV